ncbi:hypothetical protein T4D_5999 [Trichinella pseudospiralis]|uniref:Uncharacterized protein n=1 Tax=Trichinella pseudospiralis TaxID=6337 RepID=A0A0V1FMH9_TRIPS|nr:hypothetical protein T4D_5999 [Trichinella pseudospiralis]
MPERGYAEAFHDRDIITAGQADAQFFICKVFTDTVMYYYVFSAMDQLRAEILNFFTSHLLQISTKISTVDISREHNLASKAITLRHNLFIEDPPTHSMAG